MLCSTRKCVAGGKNISGLLTCKQQPPTRLLVLAPLYSPSHTRPHFFTTTTVAEPQLRRSPAFLSKITSSATHSDGSNPKPIPTIYHGDSDKSEEEGKEEILEELSESLSYLTCESTAEGGSCDVYIVGVNHLSQKSCGAVETTIRFLKPEVVFLELCSSRGAILTEQNLKVPTMRDMADMQGKENLLGMTFNWCLSKAASRHQTSLGSEFLVAFEEARKCSAEVILGDRDIQITWQRTWEKMSLLQKAKFLYYLLFKNKKMNDVDMETEFPTLMETLVHERDRFMASALRTVASKHSCVVAVIGKGHVKGIEEHWKQQQQPVVDDDSGAS